MKAARITLVTVAALVWSLPLLAAEQGATGVVTGINRLNGTIAIKRVQNGTVGAGASAAAEEFKVKDNAMIEEVHAGDRVTFSTADGSGAKTIIKLDRQ
ncbi:copper-binding protein [Bradyrhizobium ontarionense]|uniref:Copper-binding protein n=1 Tax=Bradyrhizobium ontarionense TaxID=2898149 RepID=A0ABY3RDL4_9BRAD|nr:copper-binding protein [Bradyrhizobium sp. A19]UFZ05383.1 copper-binding protein [Bradyrhizobium sp. A19]